MQAAAVSPPRPAPPPPGRATPTKAVTTTAAAAAAAAAASPSSRRARRALLRPPPRAADHADHATTTTATATATTTTTVVLDHVWTLGGGKDQLQRDPRPIGDPLDTAAAAPAAAAAAPSDRRPPPPPPQPLPFEHTGPVELITGPMFSGKSTALLARAAELEAQGRTVALVKPLCDERYDKFSIATHDGKKRSCHRVARLSDLPALLGAERWATLDAVVVDEGQFFGDLVEFAIEASEGGSAGGGREAAAAADDDGGSLGENGAAVAAAAAAAASDEKQRPFVRPKAVVVAGLSGDFRRRPFGRVGELLPLADTVRALRARCFACRGEAPFSLRLCGEAAQVLVGGPEAYRPACRACFARHQRGGGKDEDALAA